MKGPTGNCLSVKTLEVRKNECGLCREYASRVSFMYDAERV